MTRTDTFFHRLYQNLILALRLFRSHSMSYLLALSILADTGHTHFLLLNSTDYYFDKKHCWYTNHVELHLE